MLHAEVVQIWPVRCVLNFLIPTYHVGAALLLARALQNQVNQVPQRLEQRVEMTAVKNLCLKRTVRLKYVKQEDVSQTVVTSRVNTTNLHSHQKRIHRELCAKTSIYMFLFNVNMLIGIVTG